MKHNFVTKYYDTLLGEGPGGSNLYTTILSTEQKYQLIKLKSTDEIRSELIEIRKNTSSDVVYVQEERDLREYVRKKGYFWARCMYFACIVGLVTLATMDIKEPVQKWTSIVVLLLAVIVILIANRKVDFYRAKRSLVADL